MTDLWQEIWDESFGEAKGRQPTFEPEEYYRSGRASKAWPDKEGPEWWAENGPKFVKLWEIWRDNSGLEIAEVPGEGGEIIPAIELEAWAFAGNWIESRQEFDLQVKSVTDRVMTDGTDYYIVDLKTGSTTAPWPLQLALNKLCLKQTYDIDCKWGGFWSARKGGIDPEWHNLERFTDDVLWEWVWKAREIRDRQLFLPNMTNLCKSACGVREYCLAMNGSFFDQHATMTQRNTNTEKEEV